MISILLPLLGAEAQDVDVPGNLTMVDSTATEGNILKGGIPFVHNFGTDNTFLGSNAGNLLMSGAGNTGSGAGDTGVARIELRRAKIITFANEFAALTRRDTFSRGITRQGDVSRGGGKSLPIKPIQRTSNRCAPKEHNDEQD